MLAGFSTQGGDRLTVRLALIIVIALLMVAVGCAHRPVQVKFAERKCAKGTVEFETVLCQAKQPGDAEIETSNNFCPAHMVPSPIAVCVVVDPRTGALTDTVVAKGQDPFDIDDDEAAAADRPRKHSLLAFWRRRERDRD
jgi:hypothetical protein